jgi:hypothetical protein
MVDPTAQHSDDVTQVNPLNAAPVGLCGSGAIEADQVDPFQWRSHGSAPWDLYSRLGIRSDQNSLGDAAPTAQQSEVLVQLTDETCSSLWPEAGRVARVQADPSQ